MAADEVARISTLANGNVLLDGKPISLSDLDKALAALKTNHGVVWYFREDAQQEPPPQAMEAIKLVVKYRLPISMSTKADFSDAVGADGQSHPREP